MRVVASLALLVVACSSRFPAGETTAVLDVIDGDTIRIGSQAEPEIVRLLGINSPERGECQAAEASAVLRQLVAGREVRLVPEVSERDSHGRLLRFVFSGRDLINETMVRAGLAIAFAVPPDVSAAELLLRAEEAAERAQVGIWNPTACGPAATHGLVIEGIQSGVGWSGGPTEGESVVIGNPLASPVQLSGWTLRDSSSTHRFQFGDYVLSGGAELTIKTGCGRDEMGTLHWCSTEPVWNNAGDHAFLLDPNGNIVSHLRY